MQRIQDDAVFIVAEDADDSAVSHEESLLFFTLPV